MWTLVGTILAPSMAFIDSSALNVVLSTLQRDLGASGAQLLWIVNAYLLMLAALILTGGSLGDRYGRKRIFSMGIAIFATASWPAVSRRPSDCCWPGVSFRGLAAR